MSTDNRQLPRTEEVPLLASEQRGVDTLAGTILLDRYRLVELRGSGGASVVYRAEHTIMQKPIAVKILRPELALRQDFVQRFLSEARTVARLRHEHIVDIVDIGRTESGIVFCVMEFLEGEELGETLEREGRLPWPRARHIVLQVCEALAAAHAAGVVHRDIKPQNCFRVRRGKDLDFIKLLDFGIAKQIDQKLGLTATGVIVGTAEYMSPEQARGQGVDSRSDIYSLGAMLFELLAGRPPFVGETYVDILFKHAYEAIPKLTTLVPSLHPSIDDIVAGMLAKQSKDRHASVEQVAAALLESDRHTFRGLLDQAPLAERPESMLSRPSGSHPGVRPRRRAGLAAIAAVAAALVSTIVVLVVMQITPPVEQAEDAAPERSGAAAPSEGSSEVPVPTTPPIVSSGPPSAGDTTPLPVEPPVPPPTPPIGETDEPTVLPEAPPEEGVKAPALEQPPPSTAPEKKKPAEKNEKRNWERRLAAELSGKCTVFEATTVTITKAGRNIGVRPTDDPVLRECIENGVTERFPDLPDDRYRVELGAPAKRRGKRGATIDPFNK